MLRAAVLVAVLLASLLAAGEARAESTWLPAAPLTVIPGSSQAVDVALQGGDAVAVFTSGTVVQAVTRRGFGPWSAARDVSSAGHVASQPRVAVDAAGNALVVWLEEDAGGAIVVSAVRPAGGEFEAPRPLSIGGTPAAPRPASSLTLALSPSGAAVVAWIRFNGTAGVVQAVTRDSAAERFGVPEALSSSADGEGFLASLALFGPDTAFAAVSTDSTRILTRPRGGNWSMPQPIPGWGESLLAINRAGTALLTSGVRTPSNQIVAAFGIPPFDSATWSAPVLVTRPTYTHQSSAIDSDGTAIVISEDDLSNSTRQVISVRPPGGAFTRELVVPGLTGFPARELIPSQSGGVMVAFSRGARIQTLVRPAGGTFGTLQELTRTGDGAVAIARDDDGDGVAIWPQSDPDGTHMWMADFDFTAPELRDVAVPASVLVSTPASMSALASDAVSGVSVEWRFGDGDGAQGATTSHTYATPGTYEVVVTARDGVGSETRATRVIEVTAPPVEIPGPPPVPGDADGDGFPPSQDCNDANAAIRPGAREIAGNAVDEDCDGKATPFATVLARPKLVSQVGPDRRTRLLKLTMSDVAAGDSIRMSCRGGGCRKAMTRTVAVRKSAKALNLTKYIRGVKLKAKAVIGIRVDHAERISRVYELTMRPGGTGAPKVVTRCQRPGERNLRACETPR